MTGFFTKLRHVIPTSIYKFNSAMLCVHYLGLASMSEKPFAKFLSSPGWSRSENELDACGRTEYF